MKQWLDPEWRNWHKWWSVRATIFWTVVSSAYFGWVAFYNVVPPFWFMGISLLMGVSIGVARLMNQPGA